MSADWEQSDQAWYERWQRGEVGGGGGAASAWRPRNETAQDKANQLRVVQAYIAGRVPYFQELSEVLYGFDYAICDSGWNVIELVEIKCRTRWYDEMLLGAAKYARGVMLAHELGIPARFVIHVAGDGVYAHRLMGVPRDYPLRLLGRTDRGQNGDQEPCILIPKQAFTRVCDALWEAA